MILSDSIYAATQHNPLKPTPHVQQTHIAIVMLQHGMFHIQWLREAFIHLILINKIVFSSHLYKL